MLAGSSRKYITPQLEFWAIIRQLLKMLVGATDVYPQNPISECYRIVTSTSRKKIAQAVLDGQTGLRRRARSAAKGVQSSWLEIEKADGTLRRRPHETPHAICPPCKSSYFGSRCAHLTPAQLD
jgi:hypothetical protein